MTVVCDLIDCKYNSCGCLCMRDPCLISQGHCEFVYNKQKGYQVNLEYNKKEDN